MVAHRDRLQSKGNSREYINNYNKIKWDNKPIEREIYKNTDVEIKENFINTTLINNIPIKKKCEEDKGKISDGYHTFDELYEHRHLLYLNLVKHNKEISWKSKLHNDGTMYEDFFILGINLPKGVITYHLPIKYFDMIDIKELEKAPEWNGHTSKDVLDILEKTLINP